MIQLGCNYSPPLVALLEQERVAVDWIKLSRWEVFAAEFAVARPLRPVLLHVLPHAGLSPRAWPPLAAVNEVTLACASPHVALHLALFPADVADPTDERAAVEQIVTSVAAWAEAVPVPLLIENLPFYGTQGTLRCATDPATIREVCERTGVGLLLDLAHARVAAWHRQEDVYAYLAALPLARVRELHVSGPAHEPGKGLWDRHLEMQEADYDLLAWALARTAPAIVTLEYAGTGPQFEWRSDPAALERQLTRLCQLLPGSEGGHNGARTG